MFTPIQLNTIATAEHVGAGHPDKACDKISDAVHDAIYIEGARQGHPPHTCRAAIEVFAKADLVVVSGEARAPAGVLEAIDVPAIVRRVRAELGYPARVDLVIMNHIQPQASEIAAITGDDGAGDQGIMVAMACRDTAEMMPVEYAAARNLIQALDAARADGTLPYIRRDTKSQVSVAPDGRITSVIVSAQHDPNIALDQLRQDIFDKVVVPVLGDVPREIAKINHKGSFVEGGTDADAGLTGRKIVVDAFGPYWSVGGGAFSGKDPSKVDRSGAYMARALARTVLENGFADGQTCQVALAYGIGQVQPEAVMAVVDGRHDVSDWIASQFPDLSPRAIQDRLGLWERDGWTYEQTASFGHFGRAGLPWEKSLL
ncbi:methionine adenosyltransferase domain-containing protein [uncultured Tateyamaria sp.]|uniref:methionine adenosyltransferase domain-containing protein n=1 Tax=uncultured Tateyamaria sp. TaxID=455651 RepID=UPI002618A8F2|nr:methionine adenosyltransferase domain-containing protein [uncultured Tateyamaria sp.]